MAEKTILLKSDVDIVTSTPDLLESPHNRLPTMNARLFVLVGLIAAPVVRAQTPALFYDFSQDAGAVNNLGSLGTDGLLTGGATFGIGGPAGGFSGGAGGAILTLDGGDGSFVNTQIGANILGFTTDNYTAASWVRVNVFDGGDSMIFGQPGGGGTFLHNGIRGTVPHLGHWGADTGGTTDLSQVFGAGANNWFHMAFRYSGDEQSIYVNGFMVARANAGNLTNTAAVAIGRSENGGGLPGALDDVVVYTSTLSQNQIAHIAGGGNPNALPAAANTTGTIPVPNGGIAPAVPGGVGNWGVREVRGIRVEQLGSAGLILNMGIGNQTNGVQAFIDNTDPQAAGGGGLAFGPRGIFLGNEGGDDNNVAFIYRAKVSVPTADTYTFNVHADDGFQLRVGNLSWATSSGNGQIDPENNRALIHLNGTGDANTRGQIFLTAGVHDVEFITWEGGGGAGHQLSYARGSFANDGDTPTWRLLGGAGNPDNVLNIPRVNGGWNVTTSNPTAAPGTGTLTTIAAARAALTATGTTINGVGAVNYNDPQSGGPGSVGGDVPFPKDTGADDDDYAMLASGTLHIDVADTYRIGFQSDDGGYLRITGVGANPGTVDNWTIVENATGLAYVADLNGLATPEGDTLWADVLTGNSRTVGDVFLTPGDYAIESLFFERGGGSYFEVFAGDPDTGTPMQLLTSTSQNVDLSAGTLQIVPEPTSVAMLLGGFGALLGFQRLRRRK